MFYHCQVYWLRKRTMNYQYLWNSVQKDHKAELFSPIRGKLTSWEEAFGAQTAVPTFGFQPHFVSRLQLENNLSWWQEVSSLILPVTAQHQLVIVPQLHVSCPAVGRAGEVELIEAEVDTGKQACLRVVMVLAVVDDLTEAKDLVWGRVVIPQADGKSRQWRWGSRAARGSGTYGICRETQAAITSICSKKSESIVPILKNILLLFYLS